MATIEERVEQGTDRFDASRTVTVPLRDLMYTYQVLGEFIAFFHQPLNYPDLASVEDFIGTRDKGALHVAWEAYYSRLRDAFPDDVEEAFDQGVLDREMP